MKPVWCESPVRMRRGRSSRTRNGGADGVGSPGAGITGTGRRAHRAESWAACTVINSATRISMHPTLTGDSIHD